MSSRREAIGLVLFGLAVFAIVGMGIGARATYGAQTTADEPQYLLSALSLWEDGNLDISDELADERYRDFHEVDLPQQTLRLEDGVRISPHDPLLPLLLAAPMGLGGWLGAKLVLAGIGGVLAALLAWTARHRLGVSTTIAYVIAGVFALAPPLAIYSTQVYPELPAALAVLAGFAAVTGPFERRGRIVFALAVIALPWLAVKYVPIAAVLAIAGLIKAGRGTRLALIGVFSVAGLTYVLGHLAIYGGLTPYATGDHFVGGELTVVGTDPNLWGRSTRLIGLLIDRGFGIGAWQPAYFFLPLAAGWALRVRGSVVSLAAWLVAMGWIVATFVALTMHGWWFPGRQLIVILPMAVLLIAAWVHESRRRLPVLAVVGTLGLVAFGFLVIEGLANQLTWVVDFGTTANPIYQTLAVFLPDYLASTTATWVLHGSWVAFVVALGWLGWRSGGGFRRGEPRTPESDRAREKERVLT
ncbi:MAG: hypothetical protein ACLFWH_02975 [Actinomycetota bacterium]